MARSRQRSSGAPRGFDRTDRLNELLTRLLAEELERIDDVRLDLVTVMGVDTDRDLSQAKVYVTGGAADDEVIEALGEHRSRLQRAIADRARLRRTPPLVFRVDEAARSAARFHRTGLPVAGSMMSTVVNVPVGRSNRRRRPSTVATMSLRLSGVKAKPVISVLRSLPTVTAVAVSGSNISITAPSRARASLVPSGEKAKVRQVRRRARFAPGWRPDG